MFLPYAILLCYALQSHLCVLFMLYSLQSLMCFYPMQSYFCVTRRNPICASYLCFTLCNPIPGTFFPYAILFVFFFLLQSICVLQVHSLCALAHGCVHRGECARFSTMSTSGRGMPAIPHVRNPNIHRHSPSTFVARQKKKSYKKPLQNKALPSPR